MLHFYHIEDFQFLYDIKEFPLFVSCFNIYSQLSHIMRKPVYAICEQQAQISLRIRTVWSAPLLFAALIV